MEFFIRTAKTGFWLLIPLFFFTGAKNAAIDHAEFDNVPEGKYLLKIVGNDEVDLLGKIVLREFDQNPASPNEFSAIELEFDQENASVPFKLGLILTKKLYRKASFKGLLPVNQKSLGYTSKSEGVFGFCDHKEFGELPFYTQSGNVRIIEDSKTHLAGTVFLKLVNFMGDKIEVSGSFRAKKTIGVNVSQ